MEPSSPGPLAPKQDEGNNWGEERLRLVGSAVDPVAQDLGKERLNPGVGDVMRLAPARLAGELLRAFLFRV